MVLCKSTVITFPPAQIQLAIFSLRVYWNTDQQVFPVVFSPEVFDACGKIEVLNTLRPQTTSSADFIIRREEMGHVQHISCLYLLFENFLLQWLL